jgi:hypothetical protein
MPNTQKRKKAKRNKKKTKKLRGGKKTPNDSGPTSALKQVVSANLPELTAKTDPAATEDEEYELVNEGSIKIQALGQLSGSTFEITEKEKGEISSKISKDEISSAKLKEKLTELEGLESTEYKAYTNSKDSSITIGEKTTYIDLHAVDYSKTLNVDLNEVLNKKKPTDFYNNFNATFEEEGTNPETLAYLSEHLPLNFFEAVFSSYSLTKVTFKHKDFTAQMKSKKIGNIEFIFASA